MTSMLSFAIQDFLPRHLWPPAFPAIASRKPCIAASDSGDLPLDVLREILLRLSAKELCLLRVVCPSWRSLTFDPTFIAAHMTRHPETLLASAHHGAGNAYSVDIVDLSGKFVRRIPSDQDGLFVLRSRLDLICVACMNSPMALWMLNPATGSALALPQCHSEYFGDGEDDRFDYGSRSVDLYAFGRVSSTKEYKALRITHCHRRDRICEVITIDAEGRNHGVWRETHAPPSHICRDDGVERRDDGVLRRSLESNEMKYVVVGGVVHFLKDFTDADSIGGWRMTVELGSIASFNLRLRSGCRLSVAQLPSAALFWTMIQNTLILNSICNYHWLTCRTAWLQFTIFTIAPWTYGICQILRKVCGLKSTACLPSLLGSCVSIGDIE